MKSHKITFVAAAAFMTFAGAAVAQQTAPMTSQSVPPPTNASTTTPATGADTAGTPTAAAVAADFRLGAQVRDPAGVPVGTISGTSAAADGSINVVITNGAVKFALPGASLAVVTDGYSTTATKAQIDATLAGAKPQ